MTKPIATIAALDMPSRAVHRVMLAAALTVIAAGLTALTLASGLLPSAQAGAAERGAPPSLAQLKLAATGCPQCGTIEAIQQAEAADWNGGLGAIAGGLAGATVGNQIGGERGAVLLTVFGAAAASRNASLAGPGFGHAAPSGAAWRISVRMEDGSLRRVEQRQTPSLTVGDRVRMVRGNVVART